MTNIQDEVKKIHHQYGMSEVANYKIQLLCEKYAKEYHDSEVKKLNIPAVMVELPCDEEIEQQARKVNEGDIDYGYVYGAKWMRGLAKGN